MQTKNAKSTHIDEEKSIDFSIDISKHLTAVISIVAAISGRIVLQPFETAGSVALWFVIIGLWLLGLIFAFLTIYNSVSIYLQYRQFLFFKVKKPMDFYTNKSKQIINQSGMSFFVFLICIVIFAINLSIIQVSGSKKECCCEISADCTKSTD